MPRKKRNIQEVVASVQNEVKETSKCLKSQKKIKIVKGKTELLECVAKHTEDLSNSERKSSRQKVKNKTQSENEPVVKKARIYKKCSKNKEPEFNKSYSLSTDDNDTVCKSDSLTPKYPHIEKSDSCSIKDAFKHNSVKDSDSSESEWEEVEEKYEQSLDDYKPEIPQEGVEITIDCPDLKIKRRKKKEFDEKEWIRLHINRKRKIIQMNIHKTHLLCLLAHGFYANNILNSSILRAMSLSVLNLDLISMCKGKKVENIDSNSIEKILKWYLSTFTFDNKINNFENVSENLIDCFELQTCFSSCEYNLAFIAIVRTLGLKARFCVSLYPVSYKAQNLIKKTLDEQKSNSKKPGTSPTKVIVQDLPSTSKSIVKKKKVQKKTKNTTDKNTNIFDEDDTHKKEKPKRFKRSIEKNYKLSSDESDNDTRDKDFLVEVSDDSMENKKQHKKSPKTPHSNRKILSTDSEASPEGAITELDKIVCWAEVFSKPEKQWISIDCVNNIVNKPYEVEMNAPQPVTYILAYDNQSYVKDVTRRYCSEYMISTVKLRADAEWWEETLIPFLPPNSKLEEEEEKSLDSILEKKPLPHTVAGFKNHPLYALKRHLLKFEAIYPQDAKPVGFFRSEPVYPRDCVAQLHSRETWLKEARVVRIGEEPYKIVKARPKWDKMAGVLRTDLPLNVFGFWQTEPYEPPIAVNGKVPRNEYGNVELFKPCMLPRGTVHLQIPGLNRIAKKLNIDCCAAVVGFDGHKGSVHPVFDGFIICEEFKDTILAAWDEEQENAHKREEEKREKRIYGNWKKLIKGLLIRERIRSKYCKEDD